MEPRRSADGSTAAPGASESWHATSADDLLAYLESGPNGLSSDDARERLTRFGPNAIEITEPVSAWRILIAQFRGVIVYLLGAAAIIALLLGDPLDAAAVIAVLLINAAIGFVTEYRARGAMAALRRLQVPRAIVVRDGHPQEIESHGLVPGDLVLLEAGTAVPADARLLAATELRASEAPLTGESLPVDKRADVILPADTPLAERVNAVYMSTAIVAGSARAVVMATGMRTEVGRIGGLVGGIQAERTPLEDRLDVLGHRLVWITLGVTAIVVGLGLLRGEPFIAMLQTGIALAVAAVPEGLPAVSTITLAVGVARMARRQALVRRLPAVEALGSATTVCTDKTGTLTAGAMTVTAVRLAGREIIVTGTGFMPEGDFRLNGRRIDAESDPQLSLALRIGALANRASVTWPQGQPTVSGDPTEAALLVAARKAGFNRESLRSAWPESGEIPFSSERMFMATFHRGSDGDVAYLKGAPDRLIERATRVLTSEGPVALTSEARTSLSRDNREMAAQGLRVLALAFAAPEDVADGEPQNLTFVGLVGMSDPAAAGVKETIEIFHRAGIRTLMITGDQRLTAEAVARDLGILGPDDEVMEGRELGRLTADELTRRIARVSALSRVNPEEKLRIVEGLQDNGEIVAMLGDGVNDAAALKKADIGVAMGIRGTDVAKEAADVVLQDDRFPTIGAAVEEGRVIFDNIRKFVFYLFSCNLAEILVILVASVSGLPQPLLPLQILWLNLITDTFPALSLAVEPAERDVMRRPPYDPQKAILSSKFLLRVVAFAALITAATLVAFVWSLSDGPDDLGRATTIAFMTLALAQVFHLGNARSSDSVLSSASLLSNPWALGAVALSLGLQFLAVYFAPLASVLDLTPLTAEDWLVIVPLSLVPAVLGQLRAVFRRGDEG